MKTTPKYKKIMLIEKLTHKVEQIFPISLDHKLKRMIESNPLEKGYELKYI